MNIYDPYAHGKWIDNFQPSDFDNAEIVCFPGGADVSSSLYGMAPIPQTYSNPQQDKIELDLMNKAIEAKKFLVCICKGAQLLTVKAGGWLIQDVDNHQSPHKIETYDGKTLLVNSLHHQMCYPYDLPEEEYELLGWSEELSSKYTIEDSVDIEDAEGFKATAISNNLLFKEPEVIFYPKIRGLAIQSHPEMRSSPEETNAWFNELITTLI